MKWPRMFGSTFFPGGGGIEKPIGGSGFNPGSEGIGNPMSSTLIKLNIWK